jgi:hypothetical protein
MGQLLAHGTTMPMEQGEANPVLQQSERAKDKADATIE